MKRTIKFNLFLLFFVVFVTPAAFSIYDNAQDVPSKSNQVVINQIIVKFKKDAVQANGKGGIEFVSESLKNLVVKTNVEKIEPVFKNKALDTELGRVFTLTLKNNTDLENIKEMFESDPGVEYVEFNQLYQIQKKNMVRSV